MLACGKFTQTKHDVCLIRELEFQKTVHGTKHSTDIGCPLLLLTKNVYIIPSSLVYAPMSVIHICSDGCAFNDRVSPLKYVYDLTNNKFCYNTQPIIVFEIVNVVMRESE